MEERSIYRRSATPLSQEGGAQTLPNFAGSHLFMHTPRDAELPDLTSKHMWAGGLFLGVTHAPTPMGRRPSAPQFGDSFYLCVHPLSYHYKISRGYTCARGACILGPATPPIPGVRSSRAPQFWGFSCIYACTI